MDIDSTNTPSYELSTCKIQVYASGTDITVMVVSPHGLTLGQGTGRTLGRALFAASLIMVGRDPIDFMDAINAGRP